MTTAARPTWHPAVGGHSLRDTGRAPTFQTSAKEVVIEAKLKTRQIGQNAPGEEQALESMRAILEENERKHFESTGQIQPSAEPAAQMIEAASGHESDLDADESFGSDGDTGGSQDSDSDIDASDDDEDQEEAELMKELEKIRKERAEEKEKLARLKEEEENKEKEELALTGNPLLSGNTSFKVKRRWDDDVVFKNQARGVDENPKKRFINDMLRSDFHRKFMSKYIK